ncbi:unnamed protein product [Discosporangium mesarthrocarpum]
MRRLQTATQQYAWGKVGSKSKVAQLKKAENPEYPVKEDVTYAELWMGTHPNGPSRVMKDGREGMSNLQGFGSQDGPGMFLIELLEMCPHYLGEMEELGDLPIMFKILSINKALSIQAHPDKKLAERLYATRPDLYKDDNHKPEMAVALSNFEGLCGFRPFHEIVSNIKHYPELRAMVGAQALGKALACEAGDKDAQKNALKSLFEAFVTASNELGTAKVKELVVRLKTLRPILPRANSSYHSTTKPMVGLGLSKSMTDSQDNVLGIGEVVTTEVPVVMQVDIGSEGTTDHEDQDPDPEHADDDSSFSGNNLGPTSRGEAVKRWASKSSLDGYLQKQARWSEGYDQDHDQNKEDRLHDLILRLAEEYPGDIGIMMPLLLNYLCMGPGESFFMAANEPHAYLKGDIMEVMARSDNVVRVALTPKYRDVPLLCDILTYNMGAPPMVEPVRVDTFCKRYSPPIKDFELDDIMVPGGGEYSTISLPTASLGIVLEGRGSGCDGSSNQELWPGVVLFIPANTSVAIKSNGNTLLQLCIAHTNMHFDA